MPVRLNMAQVAVTREWHRKILVPDRGTWRSIAACRILAMYTIPLLHARNGYWSVMHVVAYPMGTLQVAI